MKKVLSIAGSDCSGCRNTGRFKNIFCPWRIWNECHCFSCGRKHKQSNRYTGYHSDIIEKQIDAVFEDIG